MKKIFLFSAVVLSALIFSACSKEYLETRPSNAVTEQEINSKISAIYAAIDGQNKELFAFSTNGSGRHDEYGQKTVDLQSDLMGNDMVIHTQGYGWYNSVYQYIEWGRKTSGRTCDNTWFFYFDLIKQSNKILAVIDGVVDATNDDKENVKGQVLGIRAYAYYNLVNLWQQTYKGGENKPGVPLYVTDVTEGKGRGTVQDVYNQIIADLGAAETLLDGKPRASKNNMNVDVVRGFRARVALIQEDWATAAAKAHLAALDYPLMDASSYIAINAFSSIDNPEWMWGSYIDDVNATIYASFFSHMDVNAGGYAALGSQKKITAELYDLIPVSDVRKQCWTAPGTGSDPNVDYNQVKHQLPDPASWAGDYLYMRASEMYLIEAEALARQGLDAQARSVLESMLVTSGRNPNYSASSFSGQDLINEILTQRRIELWGEGFSLIDIKRLGQGLNRATGAGNHGAPNYNPAVYTTSPLEPRFLMRIPQRELDANSSMTANDQNP